VDIINTFGGDFTLCFSESTGPLEGTIVDDSSAGSASLTGSFSFPSIKFTKVYSKASQAKQEVDKKKITVLGKPITFGKLQIRVDQEKTIKTIATETFGNPVEYEGTMSEDGQMLSGKWKIESKNGRSAGSWNAHRLVK
jgi:hypothetical protein